MKWLLILFLGIVIVPVLAQNSTINQTDYQKLENSINGTHIEYQKLIASIHALQVEQQNLNTTVYGLHTDHQQSDSLARVLTGVTFAGSGLIALVFFIAQAIQSGKIQKMTERVEQFVQIQNKLTDDVKNAYASAFVGWIHFINFNFEFIIKLYENYLAETDFIVRGSIAKSIIDYYNRDLINNSPKIEQNELLKVFGIEISDMVWRSRTHLRAEVWNPIDNKSMTALVNDYVKQIKKAVALKNVFLQFCNQQMKEQDQKDKEIYDKINSTEEFRI